MFLCKGISDPALTESEKIREKSLQRGTRLSRTRFKTLKGVVSADGDRASNTAIESVGLGPSDKWVYMGHENEHNWYRPNTLTGR